VSLDSLLRCLSLSLSLSLSLNSVPPFDGSNYGYWKTRKRFFLKSIDVWHLVESGWTTLDTSIVEWAILQKQTHVESDRAMNAICLALSSSKFLRISHCEIAEEA